MKSSPAWLQHVLCDAQLEHGIPVQDVDAAPIINEDPGEFDIDVGPNQYWIYNQTIASWVRHDLWMVFYAPADLLLGPVHELGNCRHDCIYFHCTPMLALLVSWLGYKDHIALMMFFVFVSATTAGIVVGLVINSVYLLLLVSVISISWLCIQGLSVCTRKRWRQRW